MDTFLLPYQAELLQQVDLALSEVKSTGSSRGILLVGPSGSGKTFLLGQLESRRPAVQGAGQRTVPVCVVPLSATSDPASIMRRILSVLGKPESVTSGIKVADLEWQALDAMDACGVEVLVLEEFHNALLKTDSRLRGQSSRFLKNLWNADKRGKRVILISGTDEILKVFNADDELNSRFGCRIHAPSLWFDGNGRSPHFRSIANVIAERHGVQHLIDTKDTLFLGRLLFACRGHLRRLDELCARVSTLVRQQPVPAVVTDTWALAYSQVAARSRTAQNPFSMSEERLRLQIVAERRASAASSA
jgi:predicted ATPase